jgi:hypothetical protein
LQQQQQDQQQHQLRPGCVTVNEWRAAQGAGGGLAVVGTTTVAALFLGSEGLSLTFFGGASLAM